ncbi:hypothetical protein DFP81_11670 [Marinomonas pollencensis]|uniref:Uncharacterized protein n=1 Tax=Marinomonas pollencensis TaxID=491954 RepID=A0A3E0DEQ6_9GAMM|nr:hypothetical protein DFP81_11670 [Marinomonas pollencensis]
MTEKAALIIDIYEVLLVFFYSNIHISSLRRYNPLDFILLTEPLNSA